MRTADARGHRESWPRPCRELLLELGGTPPPRPAIEAAARALIDDRDGGALLVAEAERASIVGVLGASCAARDARAGALRADPGSLGRTILARGRAIGGALIAALFELARAAGIARIEVGLPRESFADIRATEAFYLPTASSRSGRACARICRERG